MAINHIPQTLAPSPRGGPRSPAARGRQFSKFDLLPRTVKTADIIFFTSQLALMMEVGTPLMTALDTIRSEMAQPRFKRVLEELSKDIEAGRQLSDAMARHGSVFDNVFVSMAKAGETGGFLQDILSRLVILQEKRQALLQQLRSAMTYPVILTLLGLGAVTFIMVGVLPKFEAIFAGKESVLPWSTLFLMGASASLRMHWPLYLLGIFGLTCGLQLWSRTDPGRAVIDRILINGPVVRHLANRIYTSEMLRTLGYLLDSGVPLKEALQITAPTVRNRYYQKFINTIIESISQGGRFAYPFGRNSYIPGTVKQMVTVGEEVGQLPKVMRRLSLHYEKEVEIALKKFVAVIEPVALIILGGMVGVIVSSIVLPLFRLSHALQ